MFVYFFSGSDSSGVTLRASQLDGVEKRWTVFISQYFLFVKFLISTIAFKDERGGLSSFLIFSLSLYNFFFQPFLSFMI